MSQAVLFCLVINLTWDKPALEKLNWCLKLCWGFQIKLFTEASLLSRFLSTGPPQTLSVSFLTELDSMLKL